jgi:Fe-S-cluster containining protein
MFKQLEHLFTFVDTAVNDIIRQHQEAVRCRPGCADCCHAMFDVSFIEAAYIAAFLDRNRHLLDSRRHYAELAAGQFEKNLREHVDPSTARIRCPMLGDDDLCLGHAVRPLNCRTYGTPTLISGTAHVCGLSGFHNHASYPTIDLGPLQDSLREYSSRLAGQEFGRKRFPIAWIFLRLDYFLPR